MTDVFKVKWTGDHGGEMEMHPTRGAANKAASELKGAGISSVIEKVTLAKLGKKDLICALYNGVEQDQGLDDGIDAKGFAEKVEAVKEVAGVKKPKDPVLAAKLKNKQVANKHRGIMPVVPGQVGGEAAASAGASVASKAGKENPSMAPKVGGNSSPAKTAASAAGSGTTDKSKSKESFDKSSEGAAPAAVKKPVAVVKPKPAPEVMKEGAGDMSTADLKTGGLKL